MMEHSERSASSNLTANISRKIGSEANPQEVKKLAVEVKRIKNEAKRYQVLAHQEIGDIEAFAKHSPAEKADLDKYTESLREILNTTSVKAHTYASEAHEIADRNRRLLDGLDLETGHRGPRVEKGHDLSELGDSGGDAFRTVESHQDLQSPAGDAGAVAADENPNDANVGKKKKVTFQKQTPQPSLHQESSESLEQRGIRLKENAKISHKHRFMKLELKELREAGKISELREKEKEMLAFEEQNPSLQENLTEQEKRERQQWMQRRDEEAALPTETKIKPLKRQPPVRRGLF